MDIIITESSLRRFLETPADVETLSKNISLCGPTFDRVKKVENDHVFEIEVITNRVDTASAMGVAREAAAILTQFNIPAKMINDPFLEKIKFSDGLSKQFHFNIEKDLVVRFAAISVENIKVKPSEAKTQKFLENCGQRALNNCIDITNELTLLYGMPSHIFDLDKIAAQNLTIRQSKAGESITTLDGQISKLEGGDIVIEDGSGRLIDLCGVMGGQVAEVDDHTKNILLIVPVYSPKKIRRTSLFTQKRTLAAQLYEKQPDPELCLPLISKAVQLFKERAGGSVSSSLFDFYPESRPPKLIKLDLKWLNAFVGIELKKEIVISILDSLGFGGTIDDDSLTCTVPSWRYHDINIREDIAEEVARIYGYFRLPAIIPSVNLPAEPKNPLLITENKIKTYLSDIGHHEVYNNSLVSLSILEKTLVDPTDLIKLKNALSSDYEYLRTSLVPSLLENYKHNQGKISNNINLFEVANCYLKNNQHVLPDEISNLGLVSGSEFLETKGKVESLLKKLKVSEVSFKPTKVSAPYFNRGLTADIYSDEIILGQIGSIKPQVLRNMGVQSNPTCVEIDLTKLVSGVNREHIFQPISDYPLIIENITVSSKKMLGEIISVIQNTSTLIKEIDYLDSFKDKHAFRVSFGSVERNLEQSEINTIKEIIQTRFKV